MTPNEANDVVNGIIVWSILMTAVILFILPTIVGFKRKHPNRWLIFIGNLTLGGTGFVWLILLLYASGMRKSFR